MSLDTTVGKYLLRSLVGEDAKFASEPQYKIYKDETLGSWAVQHMHGAKNPTFCNGVDIGTTPMGLEDGSIISIGSEQVKLTVQMHG
jgi:hypothetical protein